MALWEISRDHQKIVLRNNIFSEQTHTAMKFKIGEKKCW